MKKMFSLLFVLIISLQALLAQESETYVKDRFAINGYDAVSYFLEEKPVKGKEQFSLNWNNAIWLFESKNNLDLFKAAPLTYAPQYGGYCAYGLSEAHKAPTDPFAFTILEGKLYFNYNLKVKEMWNRNREQRIKDADRHWPLIKDKP